MIMIIDMIITVIIIVMIIINMNIMNVPHYAKRPHMIILIHGTAAMSAPKPHYVTMTSSVPWSCWSGRVPPPPGTT